MRDSGWVALSPRFTVPGVLPPRPPLCGHATQTGEGWTADCDERAIFIRTDDDGRPEYACGSHAREAS